MEKDLSPQVQCLVLGGPRREVGIRGAEAVAQVREVGVGLIMEGLVSEEKDFELDRLLDMQPVGVLEVMWSR